MPGSYTHEDPDRVLELLTGPCSSGRAACGLKSEGQGQLLLALLAPPSAELNPSALAES